MAPILFKLELLHNLVPPLLPVFHPSLPQVRVLVFVFLQHARGYHHLPWVSGSLIDKHLSLVQTDVYFKLPCRYNGGLLEFHKSLREIGDTDDDWFDVDPTDDEDFPTTFSVRNY